MIHIFLLIPNSKKKKSRRHLSGDHVVPDEDEVDVLVSGDAQLVLDALQVGCDVRQRGRLGPAVAAQNTQGQTPHSDL